MSRASFIGVRWLIYTCNKPFLCVTWPIHAWNIFYSHMWLDLLMIWVSSSIAVSIWKSRVGGRHTHALSHTNIHKLAYTHRTKGDTPTYFFFLLLSRSLSLSHPLHTNTHATYTSHTHTPILPSLSCLVASSLILVHTHCQVKSVKMWACLSSWKLQARHDAWIQIVCA